MLRLTHHSHFHNPPHHDQNPYTHFDASSFSSSSVKSSSSLRWQADVSHEILNPNLCPYDHFPHHSHNFHPHLLNPPHPCVDRRMSPTKSCNLIFAYIILIIKILIIILLILALTGGCLPRNLASDAATSAKLCFSAKGAQV